MPTFIITIHLDGGGAATLKENAPSPKEIEQLIVRELNLPDPRLRLQTGSSVLDVKKDIVVGWSIDEP